MLGKCSTMCYPPPVTLGASLNRLSTVEPMGYVTLEQSKGVRSRGVGHMDIHLEGRTGAKGLSGNDVS
jgi:hypothetical protein